GGKAHTGRDGKFSDFLMAAASTKNVAIIEIKSPGTKLFGSEYRSGVYPPSQELSGAVAQAIAQRISFQESFHSPVGKTLDRQGYRAYSIACVVIAGRSPESEEQRQDFERYRQSLHGVHVVTFDELIDQLRAVYELMTYEPAPPAIPEPSELPF
ncbi:Shedu immune nuclease family protein, partial [Xanthomonas citri]